MTEHPSTNPGATRPPATSRRPPAMARRTTQGLRRRCHQAGLGSSSTGCPAIFPRTTGPGRYDGTALYEHEDPRLGLHADWGTHIFNYGRHEVRSFLLSSAHYWLAEFHFDGLRVDAVASMLYLDYSARPANGCPTVMAGGKTWRPSTSSRNLTPWSMASSRGPDDRRRIHRLAPGVASDLVGRPGFR